MKWCCDGLKHMFEQRNDRTIYFYAEPPLSNSDKGTYWIGMRSMNKDDIDKLKLLNMPNSIPITLNTRIPISYCPWCGLSLRKYYNLK
jgi:hypothetical protein